MANFDYLEINGTHAEMGHAIGVRFKDVIQRVIESRQKRIAGYDDYLRQTEPFFLAAKEKFPDLIEEITEVARAADVGIADYFFLNNREVGPKGDSDHCTVAVSFGDNGAVIGHNEDWDGTAPDSLYILKATIGDTTFTGLQYKALIPGVAVTTNNWGLTQCINELNQTVQTGVPKNFVARAIIECKTLDEAESIILNTRKASGYNHVLIQGQEIRNIEIAGDKIAVEKIKGKPYVHTNHYLSLSLKSLEKFHTKSSITRYNRAKELIKPGMTAVEMETLLSDKRNKKFPISRNGATLGSFVALPQEKKVYINYGPPGKGKFKKYHL
ncbi:MAG: hypothetical protein UV71_C0002G0028 [Microgenomates group bacterium GW2011_GWC1_43_13]|uniref:Peptidase C45 hydrolase domain-containing protein n=3 Tax=Candidatus Woeseibacteriota TaxID=1752722 RepID=A0A837IDH3_9BACT|nr:MAG: hypothetical protein UV71_C0002G0028 [Microgenomates group bacterium GW2011_GWC1_43_13]KKT33195.1 MAG: hypothetical protein UW20_C0004G0029 [Candidatus Woesebacteria bacterium GW2011_GWB1_44_11]KKT54467.1 MAG: hypothetical protein UW47_C0005G0015 [Candidatus Woesebacteria bacterium GW2011_GWA1_44_23]OGM83371.1 MAG: hypothetical protein A2394_00610 [Candidatus Woesebacteria bacterium RIFOXYB1_FULL_42_36]OGM87758.1 MAG: hypothetical protein A2573_00640 [Candidatus Woesebacteria bacterium 